MGGRVCAAIPTCNRSSMLRRCLESVLGQTRVPDAIMVINNASADDTVAMLSERFPQVACYTLPTNTGGAGAFHEAVKLGYERGFDWIWLMDDDGVPDKRALENLLTASDQIPEGRVFNSIVLEMDSERICFGYHAYEDRHQAPVAKLYQYARRVTEPAAACPQGSSSILELDSSPPRRGRCRRSAQQGVLHVLRRPGVCPKVAITRV